MNATIWRASARCGELGQASTSQNRGPVSKRIDHAPVTGDSLTDRALVDAFGLSGETHAGADRPSRKRPGRDRAEKDVLSGEVAAMKRLTCCTAARKATSLLALRPMCIAGMTLS